MLAPNLILQSRYRIIRLLGQGGMGAVYEAIDQRVSCVVALKETLVGSDPAARRAFEREAALLANLRHRSLAKVMDHFSEGDGQFLVMEYISGYDLAELLELRARSLDLRQVLRWAEELLNVLEYLHARQPPILHRDIKPSNLKLTKQGEIFLLDFGLAKGMAGQMSTLTTSRSIRGYTPGYAPLEQIHEGGTDPRSDLYSLGATLYHLLTEKPPVDARARFNAVEDEQPDPLLPINALNPEVSSAVAGVIQKAMSLNRRQRHGSAAEMRDALRQAITEDQRTYALLPQEAEPRRGEEEAAQRAEEQGADEESDKRRFEEAAVMPAGSQAEQLLIANEDVGTIPETVPELAGKVDQQLAQVDRDLKHKLASEFPGIVRQTTPMPAATQSEETSSLPLVGGVPAKLGSRTPGPPPEELFAVTPATTPFRGHTGPALARPAVIVTTAVIALIGAGLMLLLMLYISANRIVSGPTNQPSPAPMASAVNAHNKTEPPDGMVYVPGGTFMMGRNKSDGGDAYESPAHEVSVKSFFIDIYEVTNEDYAKFVTATNRNPPSTWGGVYPENSKRHPVTGVTWNDANDYALWAGKRLPKEEEWEFAARGTDGRLYPWGNDWRNGEANANGAATGLSDVGAFKGASTYGAFDMAGNAWEWTATRMGPYPGGLLPTKIKVSEDMKVIRGGTYQSNRNQVTTTFRRGYPTPGDDDYSIMGFRCVRETK